MTELSDSIVLVTGAARGIGRALTNGFLREGAAVIAVDRDPGGVEPFDEPDPRRILTIAADITDSNSIAAARDAALARVRDYLATRPETSAGEFELPLFTDVVRMLRK